MKTPYVFGETPAVTKKMATVKMLTIKGKPKGIVVRRYNGTRSFEDFYWVRLSDGVLLKDVSINEIDIEI